MGKGGSRTIGALLSAHAPLVIFGLLSGALLVWLLVAGPLLTNDGPVHMSFARLASGAPQPGSLQADVYRTQWQFGQSLLVYLIAGPLIPLIGPGATEALVQWLCVAGGVAAAMWACGNVRRGSAWLGLLSFPLFLNQMLFLGLYSFNLSLGGFLLCVGIALRCVRQPGLGSAALLLAGLLLTSVTHAADLSGYEARARLLVDYVLIRAEA